MTDLIVGDRVRTTSKYTGDYIEGTITALHNYKYLGLVATVKVNHACDYCICVVALEKVF